jgi:predicted TIM-barrel fold metal-dependent hydrolase
MMSQVIVSADSHVVEPAELWKERLPKSLRERAPHRRIRDDGVAEFVVEADGELLSVITANPENALQDAGAAERQPNAEGGYNASRRLADIEADGVWAEILYPTTGLWAWSMTDPTLKLECSKVYNDWIVETFAASSKRFVCGAMIPLDDIDAALVEIERAAGMGCRSIMLPMVPPAGRPYFLPDYDRIWAAAQGAGLPLTFHVITGFSASDVQQYDVERVPPAVLKGGMITVTFPAPVLITHTVMSGVLDRFPELQLVLVETQTAWLAWVMEELDKASQSGVGRYDLGELPSHYIRRQIHATFMDDRVGLHNIEFTGARPLLWGSDYPHSEGTWPNSQQELDKIFAGVSLSDRAAITGGTAAEIFHIPLPN